MQYHTSTFQGINVYHIVMRVIDVWYRYIDIWYMYMYNINTIIFTNAYIIIRNMVFVLAMIIVTQTNKKINPISIFIRGPLKNESLVFSETIYIFLVIGSFY